MTLPVVVVSGATATGKSDLALDIAENIGGEIINADSMQFYRGLDIGTAKLPLIERRGIPHHLLDILDICAESSVSQYQSQARTVVSQLHAQGKIPVVVGGSGLYIRALIDRIDFPGTDAAVREKYERLAAAQGNAELVEKLTAVDPESASKIKSSDTRRLVRALEVFELTGKPFTAFLPRPEYFYPRIMNIALGRDRSDLHTRVEKRVDLMLEQGLLDETRSLLEVGLLQAPTARYAIGYQETIAYLQGQLTFVEMREKIIIGTRKLVRKQDTWFKKDQRLNWYHLKPEQSSSLKNLPALATKLKQLKSSSS